MVVTILWPPSLSSSQSYSSSLSLTWFIVSRQCDFPLYLANNKYIESFVRVSKSAYHPKWFIQIDKIMVAYSCQFFPIKRYMKAKPCRYAIKIWCLASSKNRYVWNLDVDLGASGEKSLQGTKHDVVINLTSGLENRGHVVVTDSFFLGLRLFESIIEKGIWAIRTMRTCRNLGVATLP